MLYVGLTRRHRNQKKKKSQLQETNTKLKASDRIEKMRRKNRSYDKDEKKETMTMRKMIKHKARPIKVISKYKAKIHNYFCKMANQ